jgi:acetylornithine deacetylase/succinyl-diaminopimelate desuccinylase-like protein
MSEEQLRDAVARLMPMARADLERLVAIPSVADPQQFPAERCLQAAEYVRQAMAAAGIQDCRLLEMPDGHPAVFGHTPAPAGAPTVLLYCHHDVQPPLALGDWLSPPFELTERDGRWYGRGAADCKGNVVAHLTALRALGGEPGREPGGGFPVGVKLISEGAEEQGSGGLEQFVAENPELLRAEAVLICDCGNFAAGVPTLTTTLRGMASVLLTVSTLQSAMHSGMFGGPAPDALIALTRMLATLHDERGNTAVKGLHAGQSWDGVQYPERQFRADARMLDGVQTIGDGSISEMLWARPSVNVLGIDCPAVVGATASLQPQARARVSLRVPPGTDPLLAQDALVAHLEQAAPWGARVQIERDVLAAPFAAGTDGPAYAAMVAAMQAAYGARASTAGQGGSIPLCSTLQHVYPDAEIMLLGVEEPQCLIHAANESVDPREIERTALAEALFLQRYVREG